MPDLEILRVPNIEYSKMYFPAIAARLRQYSRVYAPEITNEDRREIVIQLERAYALMAHYNNVLLDMVAGEMFPDTARLPESVKLHMALINYRLLPSSPSRVDLLGTLSRDYTAATRLLESTRRFATQRTPDDPEIVFENSSSLDTSNRTDEITNAHSVTQSGSGTCSLSSINPDIVTYVSGDTWVDDDINRYLQISGSVLGNNTEDLRIIELLDETSPGSGVWNQVRLSGASFLTEGPVDFVLREVSTNHSTSLNAGTGTGVFASAPEDGDKFYFGHSDIMWDRFDVTLSSGQPSILAVWEFYDNSDTTYYPDAVEVDPATNPGHLRFTLSSFLGVEDRHGALIRVMHVESGAELNAVSTWEGGLNVVDIDGYLDQSSPSTTADDYLIFCEWRPVDVITDTTKTGAVPWEGSGYTSFTLPQSQSDNWQQSTLYDKVAGELLTGYFLRLRIVDNSGAATFSVPTTLLINNGDKYAIFEVIQGKTVEDDPLGSSDGTDGQQFTLKNSPYIYESIQLYVDEGGGDIEWDEVETFLTSYSTDRHFTVDVRSDGSAVIEFGDGINGRIPPLGTNNIRATYRIGADEDGNIGANTLTVNRDGVGVFSAITNPRVGQYWVEADWNSQDALERAKEAGPLNLQTMLRVVTPRDAETLAKAFKTTQGVKPVARAKAYEEAFGPKTMELVVAGGNGAALSSDYKAELEEFFNGGDTYGGVALANHEITVTNYIPRSISYTIEVTAHTVVTEDIVLQALSSLISPTAVEEDGRTYVWEFGQEVPNSRVIAGIFNVSPGNVFKVNITSPASDVGLETKELPVLDASNTNIVIVEPNF